MDFQPPNGIDTDRPPAVQNLRSRFEQLALDDKAPKLRPRHSGGSQRDLLDPSVPRSPRLRTNSSTSSNGTPFDTAQPLRPSSSSGDLNVTTGTSTKRPPPPPPSRTTKALSSSPDLNSALLRPVPVPPSPRQRSLSPANLPASTSSYEASPPSSLRHKIVPAPPPPAPRQTPTSVYPTDTHHKPAVPRRHANSDTTLLRPSPDNHNITDTTLRTTSPLSDEDHMNGEISSAYAPPTHPARRKQLHQHHPSSETNIASASSESDFSMSSSRSSRPSSRFRSSEGSLTTSPSTSPIPPPLPTRRLHSTTPSISSEEPPPPPLITASSSSPRIPPRPNVGIPAHISLSDSPSASPTSATAATPDRKALGSGKLPPPPTRTIAPGDKLPVARRPPTPDYSDEEEVEEEEVLVSPLPDRSRTSRRPPVMSFQYANVAPNIHVHTNASVLVAGTTAVVAHHGHINTYDLSISDIPQLSLEMKALVGKEFKILSMEFRPSAQKGDRGFLVWIGTKEGHLFEMDVRTGKMLATKFSAHPHPIIYMFRYGRAMITLDDSGKTLIWTPDPSSGTDITLTQTTPRVVRLVEHPTFAKIIGGRMWIAVRGETQSLPNANGNAHGHAHAQSKVPVIRVYDIFKAGNPSRTVVPIEHVGAVTGATLVPSAPGFVYVGHEAGAVSIWSLNADDGYPTCVEVMKISNSDVLCVEGVNDRLWAGGRGGMIESYDVTVKPWVVRNAWLAHPGLPVTKIAVDHYGIDKIGRLCVFSIGRDEQLRLWDGLVGLDWVDEELLKHEHTFTTTRRLKVLIVSWNCDAARPDSLSSSTNPINSNFITDVLQTCSTPPDIVSFGFQEVIDLESRKMVAKNLLTSKDKNDDSGLSERVTGAYRRWNDKLILEMKRAWGVREGEEYDVVSTNSLVGLFSCVFVRRKEKERGSVRDVSVSHVKTGMRGRYGNKGGIVSRFVLDDSSFCLLNCHLAAGQNAVRQRNADVTAILEKQSLFAETHFPFAYVGGGDGTMILDHEIVIMNGDMNYRIDHRREAILSAVKSGEYSTLLIHDQLNREIKFNRACRLRGFSEGPLTFAPTYKYDPHTTTYDTSEKRRSPAWCDRVLWRARVGTTESVELESYRRWEVDVSDHRPVSANFSVTVKRLRHEERQRVKAAVQSGWVDEQNRLLLQAKKFYVKQLLI